uniref:ATPase subunit 8 n=1 Tax=Microzonia abyssicola TaxID=217214 RepID=UPI002E762420|nr:ATPase subunit 8 [Syringoderma abyssicola]WBP70380.1 ATPase subunit 8 [Syringoderma abyssicola]
MPQFDVSSFFNQIFWLSLFFCTFYLILVGFLLPHLVSSLKLRNKKRKERVISFFSGAYIFEKD